MSDKPKCSRNPVRRRGRAFTPTDRRMQYEIALRTYNPEQRTHGEVVQRYVELLVRHPSFEADGSIKENDPDLWRAVKKLGIDADWALLCEFIEAANVQRQDRDAASNFSIEKWLLFETGQPHKTANETQVRDVAARRLASETADALTLREHLGSLEYESFSGDHPLGERLSRILEIYMEGRSIPRWQKMLAKDQRRWLAKVTGHAEKLAAELENEDAFGNPLPSIREMLKESWANVHDDFGFRRRQRLRVAAGLKKAEELAYSRAGVKSVSAFEYFGEAPPPTFALVLRKLAERAASAAVGYRSVGHANADDAHIKNFVADLDDRLRMWFGPLPAHVVAACVNTLYPNQKNSTDPDDVKRIRKLLSIREPGED